MGGFSGLSGFKRRGAFPSSRKHNRRGKVDEFIFIGECFVLVDIRQVYTQLLRINKRIGRWFVNGNGVSLLGIRPKKNDAQDTP